MAGNSKVLPSSQGAPIDDLLTDLAREGARRLRLTPSPKNTAPSTTRRSPV
jgi:hypothetical protein